MTNLASKKCKPCEDKNIKPMSREEVMDYLAQLINWSSLEDKKITKEYKFQDFIGAINFINLVADIAEEEGHHPDIFLHDYNKVTITLWTHSIGGLSENDFIVAARIDEYHKK